MKELFYRIVDRPSSLVSVIALEKTGDGPLSDFCLFNDPFAVVDCSRSLPDIQWFLNELINFHLDITNCNGKEIFLRPANDLRKRLETCGMFALSDSMDQSIRLLHQARGDWSPARGRSPGSKRKLSDAELDALRLD